jgi:hypothetical protein
MLAKIVDIEKMLNEPGCYEYSYLVKQWQKSDIIP